MSFLEEAINRAGLGDILRARRAGEHEKVRATMDDWKDADLLVLGAVADLVRTEEVGDAVVIHKGEGGVHGTGIFWIDPHGATELEVLRAVAVTRIAGPARARIGIDWSRHGIELAQVALGFGASELRGAIQKKSGLPILEDETKKLKGQGNVSLASIKKAEIAALVMHAGRRAVFEGETTGTTTTTEASAHV